MEEAGRTYLTFPACGQGGWNAAKAPNESETREIHDRRFCTGFAGSVHDTVSFLASSNPLGPELLRIEVEFERFIVLGKGLGEAMCVFFLCD